jgi:pectate lyase
VGTGGAAGASCTTPPPSSVLTGWASLDGLGVATTTGGAAIAPITVTTAAAFITNAAGATPRVIYVMGSLTGVFSIGSNKTVVGLCGASLHGHVSLSNAVNVIVRNLTIVGNNCADRPTDCSGGADAVTIGDNSHHVWFDHDDVYDGSDGNLDITSGADFVTISWTKFHYSSMRTDPLAGTSGHRFSNLIGSADTVLTDVGHLNVTFHHDWWAENVNQRMPRTRFGQIHVVNNLFTSVGNSYCTNAGFMATVLVENNVYLGVQSPLQEDANGSMLARGNLMQGTSGGTAETAATGPGFVPRYQLVPEVATTALATTIMGQAGPH